MDNVVFDQVKTGDVHEKLIKTIRTAITEKEFLSKTEKEKMASILADILCLGKESVYRRIRGDVRFSFEEVALIARSLDFSIDNILGVKDNEKAIFEINMIDSFQINGNYNRRIEEYTKAVKKMSKYPDSELKSAFNSLPYLFYLQYEGLSKFKLFKWAYQIQKMLSMPFRDFVMEKEAVNTQKKYISEIRKIKRSSIIISQDVFTSMIKEINYFHRLNLLNNDDIQMLKGELLELLTEIEILSISGYYNNQDSEVYLYLSNVDIDGSYALLKNNGRTQAFLGLYGINMISSEDNNINEIHNQWIDSLKRYSTLITFGGEIQRHIFFEQQRDLINTLHI